MAMIMYRVLRYRRKVVRNNLTNAFPDRDMRWIKEVERDFYIHLSSVFHEMMFSLNFHVINFLERIHYTNVHALAAYEKDKRPVMILAGHHQNWELLGLTLPLTSMGKSYGAARRQSDSFFNQEVNRLRSRMGLEIVPSESFYRTLLKSEEERILAFLIADQSPPASENYYRVDFLNQPTAVLQGPEQIARRLNMAVFYADIERTAPGRYKVTFQLITDRPNDLEEGVIAQRYMKHLEESIQKSPSAWLWSHRRWKHNLSSATNTSSEEENMR